MLRIFGETIPTGSRRRVLRLRSGFCRRFVYLVIGFSLWKQEPIHEGSSNRLVFASDILQSFGPHGLVRFQHFMLGRQFLKIRLSSTFAMTILFGLGSVRSGGVRNVFATDRMRDNDIQIVALK